MKTSRPNRSSHGPTFPLACSPSPLQLHVWCDQQHFRWFHLLYISRIISCSCLRLLDCLHFDSTTLALSTFWLGRGFTISPLPFNSRFLRLIRHRAGRSCTLSAGFSDLSQVLEWLHTSSLSILSTILTLSTTLLNLTRLHSNMIWIQTLPMTTSYAHPKPLYTISHVFNDSGHASQVAHIMADIPFEALGLLALCVLIFAIVMRRMSKFVPSSRTFLDNCTELDLSTQRCPFYYPSGSIRVFRCSPRPEQNASIAAKEYQVHTRRIHAPGIFLFNRLQVPLFLAIRCYNFPGPLF